MSKVNVNSASRDDLVNVAGLRPDIADAVLEFRRKNHKITDVQALEELPGVGPATIDQLRKALDFGDKGGNGSDRAKGSEKDAGRAAERTTEAVSSAARGGTEAARQVAESGARAALAAAHEGLGVARQVADVAAETEREVVGRSAEGAAELGRLWVDLLGEQTRHNLEVATALGRAVRWDEVVQVQSEFARASFERLGELNRRYLEIVQGMMDAGAASVERVRKTG